MRQAVSGSFVRRRVLLAMLLMFSSLWMASAAWGQASVKRSIQVEGQATMSVEPDLARLSLGVETQGDTAAKAQALLADRAASVLAALTRAGLDRAKITTSSFRVSPVYSTKQDKQNTIIGYRAETTLAVELSDLPSVAAVVDAAMAAGANAVRSLTYDRANMESYKEQLIRAACDDAAMKAGAAAGALGAKLGGPVSVDLQDSFAARDTANFMVMKAAASPDFLSPGELEISASVRVEFELLVQ